MSKQPGPPQGDDLSKEAIDLAAWYGALGEHDKANIRIAVQKAAQSAVFGLLAILDGVRAVEEPGEKGEFELLYRKGNDQVLLNDPQSTLLHDLFSVLCRSEEGSALT